MPSFCLRRAWPERLLIGQEPRWLPFHWTSRNNKIFSKKCPEFLTRLFSVNFQQNFPPARIFATHDAYLIKNNVEISCFRKNFIRINIFLGKKQIHQLGKTPTSSRFFNVQFSGKRRLSWVVYPSSCAFNSLSVSMTSMQKYPCCAFSMLMCFTFDSSCVWSEQWEIFMRSLADSTWR